MLLRSIGTLIATVKCAAAFAPNCTGINAVSPKWSSPETAYKRDFFYIGGHYLYNDSLKAAYLSTNCTSRSC
jgi:hypothetical protein